MEWAQPHSSGIFLSSILNQPTRVLSQHLLPPTALILIQVSSLLFYTPPRTLMLNLLSSITAPLSPSLHASIHPSTPAMRARNVRANSPSATPSFPAYACIYLLLPPFTCSRNPRFARDSVPIRTLLPLPSLFRTTTTSKVQCGENILNDSIDFTHPNHIM